MPPTSFAAAERPLGQRVALHPGGLRHALHPSPTAEVEPWLATEWSLQRRQDRADLTLRDDVKFTDGTPFNADAAAQNILRFRDGTSPNASNLANVADAKAVDPTHRRRSRCRSPTRRCSNYLAQNAGAAWRAPKRSARRTSRPTRSAPARTSSTPARRVVGSKYVYTKNPDYWAPDDQHYDNLIINVYDNTRPQVNAIKGGQVDGVNLIDQRRPTTRSRAPATSWSPHELDWTGPDPASTAPAQLNAGARQRRRSARRSTTPSTATPMLKAVAAGPRHRHRPGLPRDLARLRRRARRRLPATTRTKAKELLADAGYPDGFTLDDAAGPGRHAPSATTWSSSTSATSASRSTTPSSPLNTRHHRHPRRQVPGHVLRSCSRTRPPGRSRNFSIAQARDVQRLPPARRDRRPS